MWIEKGYRHKIWDTFLLTRIYLDIYVPVCTSVSWITYQIHSINRYRYVNLCLISLFLESEKFNSFFYRGEDVYNSSYFPSGNFVFYAFANCAGFCYVNISNMNCTRKTLYESAHSAKKDFIYTMIFAPLMFMTSAMLVLRSPHDISSTQGSKPYSDLDCFLYN